MKSIFLKDAIYATINNKNEMWWKAGDVVSAAIHTLYLWGQEMEAMININGYYLVFTADFCRKPVDEWIWFTKS